MKTLIIGGTGLISTYTTQLLAARGDDVTLYNRGQSIYPTPVGVKTILGDRTHYETFVTQIAEAGVFDVVIDMVGYHPDDAECVVRAFRGRTVQFIFCSTVDVYLKPATLYPYTEAEAYGGLNDYASNKVKIEKRLWQAHQAGDFPVTIIRPAYTYGEGRGPLHSLGWGTAYMDRIRRGLPVVVHGDGTALWTACHAADVGAAFAAACGKEITFGKAYHTAGEEWMPWNTYHARVAEALAAPPPRLVHIPTDLLVRVAPRRCGIIQQNFQFNNIFDNTAAHTDLSFCYTVDWLTGVRRMAAWLDANGGTQKAEDDPFEHRLVQAWERFGSDLERSFSE